jgi:UDP-2,3-diacylglucosamine pyrophosphatase LpxH
MLQFLFEVPQRPQTPLTHEDAVTGSDKPADAIVISDIHLGSDNCQAKQLRHFLEELHHGRTLAHRLILNGDVFDSIDFRRLKKSHWKVLGLLRKLSKHLEVIWVCGNHDGSAEIVSHLLGLTVVEEYEILSGGKRVLFLHGHQFDRFIERYPVATWFGDFVYRTLQKLDRSHHFAKLAKRKSKVFLRNHETIRAGAVEHAQKLGCHVVCSGHTHHAVAVSEPPVEYFNSGCWTEKPCHYLFLLDGVVQLRTYPEFTADQASHEVSSPTSIEEPQQTEIQHPALHPVG